MKEAYFRLEHTSFNRASFGYGRVAALAHYAANRNKLGAVVTVGLPQNRNSTERRILELEESNTRKNARLGDGILVSLPKELTPADAKRAMEKFLWKITVNGRTYAKAWEHIDHPDNPHFHVVLIDRDQETGKAVAKLGHSRSYRASQGLEPNPTEWLRKMWEDAGNEVFEERGYDLYLDRRNYLEKEAPEPGQHRGFANDNALVQAPLSTDMPVDVPHETEQLAATETPAEDALELEGDDDMAGAAKFNDDATPRQLLQLLENLDYATRKMADREALHDKIRKSEYDLKRVQGFLSEAETKLSYATQAEYNAELKKEAMTKDGKPIGFGVKVFGFSLRTSTRKLSDQAIERHASAKEATERQALLVREHQEAVQRVEAHQKSLDDQLFVLDRQLRQIGTDKELDTAVEAMRKGIRESLTKLTREQIEQAHENGDIGDEQYEYLLGEGNFDRSQGKDV